MARLETDDEDLARREIEMDDDARASRMSEHFGVRWGEAILYDLTLNTERVPIPTCVDLVVALAKSAAFQETPESRRHLADFALSAKARAALMANESTADIDIAIDAKDGRLVLRGIVVDEDEQRRCHEVIASLPGVAGVDDELRTMSGRLARFPTQVKK
jgi:hypothetical protein